MAKYSKMLRAAIAREERLLHAQGSAKTTGDIRHQVVKKLEKYGIKPLPD